MNKKRMWLLIPAALIPYITLGAVVFLLESTGPVLSWIMDHLFFSNGLFFAAVILLVCLLAAALCVTCFVMSIRKKWDALWLAKTAMWIKLLQIPAYILIFALGMILAITLFTIPFAIVMFLMNCLSLAMTGLLNLSAVIAACREGKTSLKKSWWVIALQAVFCADVVASVLFYRHLKKFRPVLLS